jgi:RNA polymerase sigma-70 factor (ECF subfamily)
MRRDLIDRARQGDHDAFAELARDSVHGLFVVARLILRDDARAEDATQEALVSAWTHIGALRDPDRFDAWLHRMLVNACYREARRQRRRGALEIHVDPVRMAEAPGPTDMGLELAGRDELERGFRRLDTDQRSVLVLHYYLGLSLDEVAEVLGIPPGTVRSRLHRAMVAMRAALAADAATPLRNEGRMA